MAQGLLRTHKDFNRLWFGQTVSNFGDRISRIALPTIAIVGFHAGALQVGILAALGSLPFLFLSPFAGAWIDRMPRRTVLIVADIGRLLTLGSVPLAYAVGGLSMAQLYIVATVTCVLTVFFEVAYQAYLPALVGREAIMEGNQKLQMSRSVAGVAGSAAGGGLMQLIGNALAVVVDAGTFLVSAISLLLIGHREPARQPSDAKPSVMRDIREGFGTIGSDGRLRNLMLSTTLVNLATGTAAPLVLLFAYNLGHLNQGEVGAAFAAGGVGMVLGGILAKRLAAAVTVSGSLVVSILAVAAAVLVIPSAGAGLALMSLIISQLLLGFSFSVYQIHVLSLVQTVVPLELLGRVNGAALSVVWGMASLGGVLAGGLGALVGIRGGLFVAGAVAVGSLLPVVFSPLREVRQLAGQPRIGAAATAPDEAPAAAVPQA